MRVKLFIILCYYYIIIITVYVSWHFSVSARVTSPPAPPFLFQIPVSPFVLSFHYPRNCHCRYLDAILQHSFSRSFSPTLHVSSTLPAYLSHLPSFHFIIRLSSPWSFRSLYRCLSVLTLGLRLSHSLAVCFVTILSRFRAPSVCLYSSRFRFLFFRTFGVSPF